MDYNSEDLNMPEDNMQEVEDEISTIEEGDFVSFHSEGHQGDQTDRFGRVEYIMTDGSFGVEGSEYNVPASYEDPVLLLRLFDMSANGASETELLTGRKLSEVTLEAPPMGWQDQMDQMNVSAVLKSIKDIQSAPRLFFRVEKGAEGCPIGKPFGVIGEKSGTVHGCHATVAEANKQLSGLYAATSPANGYKPKPEEVKNLETPEQHDARRKREKGSGK
jgi:hypothetical protein